MFCSTFARDVESIFDSKNLVWLVDERLKARTLRFASSPQSECNSLGKVYVLFAGNQCETVEFSRRGCSFVEAQLAQWMLH